MRKWSRDVNCSFKVKLLVDSVETDTVETNIAVETDNASMDRSRVLTRDVSQLHTRLLSFVVDTSTHLFQNSLFARSEGKESNKDVYVWEKGTDLKVIHTATKICKLVQRSILGRYYRNPTLHCTPQHT